MTGDGIATIVLFDLGVGCADLVAALSDAGKSVTLVEPDPSDAERVGAILRRRFPDAEFSVTPKVPNACDLFLCPASDAEMAPDGAIIGLTDGPAGLQAMTDPARFVALDLSDLDLVELAIGTASDAVRLAVIDLMEALGAQVAVTTTTGAFAGTMLQDSAIAMIDRLLLRGQTPWELDEALETAGFTQGVLKAQDAIGLEVAFARRRAAGTDLLVADRMVREGRLGRSVGVGWYRYPGGGGAVIDPLMEDMIVEEAHFAGIAPKPIADSLAAEILICGIMNTAAGVLADPSIDQRTLDRIVEVKLGLPDLVARSAMIGEAALRAKLEEGQMVCPDLWAPSAELRRLF